MTVCLCYLGNGGGWTESCDTYLFLLAGGGDWEECYELVLNETREKLSWTPGTQRSLVMIGDAIPHGPTYPMNSKKLDWKVEAKKLKDEAGVKVYSVQALNNSGQ